MASMKGSYKWLTQSYIDQQKMHWPRFGKHILAQYDDRTVVVYQAYNSSIADYAVHNQRFGGPNFSFERMSWIKTNFLWMTYRCGWARKPNQEHVLAVRITREGFEEILRKAYTASLQKSRGLTNEDIEVRLQWDPDHAPDYSKLERRAIQLGLKGNILEQYGTQFVVQIEDITPFVHAQKRILDQKGEGALMVACERVYTLRDVNIAARIQLDPSEEELNTATVVKGFTKPETSKEARSYSATATASASTTCENLHDSDSKSDRVASSDCDEQNTTGDKVADKNTPVQTSDQDEMHASGTNSQIVIIEDGVEKTYPLTL